MIKLFIDNEEIDRDYYRSLTQSNILFDKNFCLGSVPSNTFRIELNNKSNVDKFEKLRIELDKQDYAHVYYDNLDNSNDNKSIISLSDAMVDFEFNYDASPLIERSENGYVTTLEILEDICSKIGVTLATKDFNLKDKKITWYDNTITARQYISYIATLNGGFAKINRNGELELVRYTNDIKTEINSNTCSSYKIGEYHKIMRVVWDIGVDKWEYGDETGNTLYLDTDNPFITEKEDVESIYNLINGFEFYSIEIAKCPIDSTINAGDIIAFRNEDNLYPFIAQLELSYNAGFHGGYKFVVNTEKVEETSVNNTTKSIKSIKSRLNRDEAQLEITAQETKETKKALNDITNPIITKQGNNHLCIEEAAETNALEYVIEGKCEQEKSAEYNLITNQGMSTPITEINYWKSIGKCFTPLTDGWCRQSFDGTQTSRWSNSFIDISAIHVKPNSEYTLFIEVRNSTNNLLIQTNDGGVNGGMFVEFEEKDLRNVEDGIYKANVTTLSDLSNKVLRIFVDSSTTTKIGSVEYRVMLIEGHHANENLIYKAYTPNSPTPEYPSEIKTIKGIKDIDEEHQGYWLKSKVTGKNFLNPTDMTSGGYSVVNGTYFTSSTSFCTKNKIKIDNTKDYYLSHNIVNTTQYYYVLYYDENENYLGNYSLLISNKSMNISNYNNYSQAKYINIRFDVSLSEMNEIQLEEGSQATEYESYKGKEILVDLKDNELCSIEDTNDTLEVVSGRLEKRIVKIILDGSENWAKEQTVSDGYRFNLNLNDIKPTIINSEVTTILCNRFEAISPNQSWSHKTGICSSNGIKRITICYESEQTNTVEKFKQWLSNNPTTVYYELEEPQEIQLTPTNIPLFEGENHIELEEDIETNISIKYLKKNALNEVFQTKIESQAQMEITSNEINNSVSSVKTELKNDLMVTNEKFNQYALQQVLVEQINSVLQKITDSEARIEIMNQIIKDGVPITKTETGYTFDINGLNISSTDAEVNSLLSSIGLSLLDNIKKETLLFAGYDKDLQETIVKAQNMIIQKYLIVPHARFESYNNPKFGKGTGCFYVD